jgi:hypothetical protein
VTKGSANGAAVARLQHGRLDFDESVPVEVAADRRDDPRAQEELSARVLVDEQVEVALPVAGLDVGQPVERVGERAADLRQQLELRRDERRLTAARTPGAAGHADDVAEVEVDLLLRDELDPARAIDEDRGRSASPSRAAP